MKIERYLEWRDAVERMGSVSWWVLGWRMVKAARMGFVDKVVWRRRMRICGKCTVYRHGTRTCGLRPGAFMGVEMLGCGCYVPFLARAAAPYRGEGGVGCWGRAQFGDSFGWSAQKLPKTAQKAWVNKLCNCQKLFWAGVLGTKKPTA